MNPIVTLHIDKLVYGGYGLAFFEGRAYFILDALPGETVRAEITREKKNTAFGKSIEILERSPLRVEPPCPHFMRCGGCHLQQLPPAEQLRFKEEILRETFRRIGRIDLGKVEVVSGEPWHYRTRAQFKINRRQGEVNIGFYAAQSHRVWPIDQCPLLAGKLNSLLGGIQKERTKFDSPEITAEEFQLRTNGDESEAAMDFVGEPPDLECAAEDASLTSTGFVMYRTKFGRFRVGSNSFFQVNRFLLETLVEKGIGDASGKVVLDLFSGVGLFSVALAGGFERIIAVEENPGAVEDLRANVKMNECGHIEIVGGDVAAVLRWGEEKWAGMDLVLLDPPRQGVQKEVLWKLAALQVPRCVYVSCDPTSMARDVRVLMEKGYRIREALLLDLFPQTYHFETIMKMEREGASSMAVT